jgi:hypothetical protein
MTCPNCGGKMFPVQIYSPQARRQIYRDECMNCAHVGTVDCNCSYCQEMRYEFTDEIWGEADEDLTEYP